MLTGGWKTDSQRRKHKTDEALSDNRLIDRLTDHGIQIANKIDSKERREGCRLWATWTLLTFCTSRKLDAGQGSSTWRQPSQTSQGATRLLTGQRTDPTAAVHPSDGLHLRMHEICGSVASLVEPTGRLGVAITVGQWAELIGILPVFPGDNCGAIWYQGTDRVEGRFGDSFKILGLGRKEPKFDGHQASCGSNHDPTTSTTVHFIAEHPFIRVSILSKRAKQSWTRNSRDSQLPDQEVLGLQPDRGLCSPFYTHTLSTADKSRFVPSSHPPYPPPPPSRNRQPKIQPQRWASTA